MVYDEYGYDAGPDGFGTDVPPGKGWALFGYYESEKEARDAVSFSNSNDDQGYRYAVHPNKPSVVIWRRRPMAGRQMTSGGCRGTSNVVMDHCPICGGSDITAIDYEEKGKGVLVQEVSCLVCASRWRNKYEICDQEVVEEGWLGLK